MKESTCQKNKCTKIHNRRFYFLRKKKSNISIPGSYNMFVYIKYYYYYYWYIIIILKNCYEMIKVVCVNTGLFLEENVLR